MKSIVINETSTRAVRALRGTIKVRKRLKRMPRTPFSVSHGPKGEKVKVGAFNLPQADGEDLAASGIKKQKSTRFREKPGKKGHQTGTARNPLFLYHGQKKKVLISRKRTEKNTRKKKRKKDH